MMIEYPIGSLAPSKSKQVKLPIGFPAYIPGGTYNIGINLDGEDQILIDSPIEIAEPSIDITGSLTGSIPSKIIVIGNSTHVAFSLVVTNNGTTLTSKSQTIGIAVYGRQQPSEPHILLGQISGCNVGNIANGQGLKGNFTVPIEISDAFVGGKYDLVAFVDSQNVISEGNEDDNWISLGQADIEVIDSLMDITLFNGGHTLEYNTTITGNYYDAVGKGTLSTHFSSDGTVNEYFYDDDDDDNTSDGDQKYQWSDENDGVHLTKYIWRDNSGWWCYNFDFDSLVIPSNFQLKQKHNEMSEASGFQRLWGFTVNLEGAAETTCEIVGIENIAFGGVKYEAFKITFSLVINSTGALDLRPSGDKYYNVTSLLKQNIVLWAVPGTGVVKSTTKNYCKISFSNGGGYELWSGSESRELIP